MLTAVSGYYDGSYIVLNENIPVQKGQKVIITLDVNETPAQKKVNLSHFMGRGEKMFQADAFDYVKEFRENDRIS